MNLVIDASLVVSALVDSGAEGHWAEAMLSSHSLAAPHLMPIEAANILRRASMAGDLSDEIASIAHDELLALNVTLFPYEPLASRVWELRSNVTAYDACYVALAEALKAPLATLDRRLARAPGPLCAFEFPRDC